MKRNTVKTVDSGSVVVERGRDGIIGKLIRGMLELGKVESFWGLFKNFYI